MNHERFTVNVTVWRVVCGAAALWTMLGAVPGILDAATTFERFYGAPAESELVLELLRGSWGQSLLFALGYVLAVVDPWRNAAFLLLGGIGKAAYAWRLARDVIAGAGGPLALVAVAGDVLFVVAFALLLARSGVLRSIFTPRAPESSA